MFLCLWASIHGSRMQLWCSVGRIFAQNAVVSDDLPARIISGRVQVKPNVKEFCGSRAVFVDGSITDKVLYSAVWLVQERFLVCELKNFRSVSHNKDNSVSLDPVIQYCFKDPVVFATCNGIAFFFLCYQTLTHYFSLLLKTRQESKPGDQSEKTNLRRHETVEDSSNQDTDRVQAGSWNERGLETWGRYKPDNLLEYWWDQCIYCLLLGWLEEMGGEWVGGEGQVLETTCERNCRTGGRSEMTWDLEWQWRQSNQQNEYYDLANVTILVFNIINNQWLNG